MSASTKLHHCDQLGHAPCRLDGQVDNRTPDEYAADAQATLRAFMQQSRASEPPAPDCCGHTSCRGDGEPCGYVMMGLIADSVRCECTGRNVSEPTEYFYCGATVDPDGAPTFTCNRRVAHKGNCSPDHDEENPMTSETTTNTFYVAPVTAVDGELVADLDEGKTSVKITDAIDRISGGIRQGSLYAVWAFDARPNPAEAVAAAREERPARILVHVGGGEMLQLDDSYRLHLQIQTEAV